MNNNLHIEELIHSNGFKDYKWIDPHEIIVSQWVRVKCQFGCSDYGLGTCPPNTPDVAACRDFFDSYEHGLILRLNVYADKNNYPSAWSRDITNKLLDLEKSVFLSGFPKAFLLNQTCCNICKDCPGNRVDCKDKNRSRPSPEAFAVDVYNTCSNVGMKINVVPENPSEINRIAMLLVE